MLVFTSLFLPVTTKAQVVKTDSVFWDNGHVSLLSDLSPVLIILKKGSDLKNVRIKEIKKERGILVYETEKCLHDVNISNIKRIQAGKYTTHPMFFYADNTPYIKMEDPRIDPMVDYQEFRSVKMPLAITVKPKSVVVTEQYKIKITPSDVTDGCDTIIEKSGIITLAKIIEVDARLISYKKMSNPDGPIYIKANNNATITKYGNCMSIHLK